MFGKQKLKSNIAYQHTARTVLATFGLVVLVCAYVITLGLFAGQVQPAEAAIPKYINFQGKLTAVSNGGNVANGTYAFEFKLYDDPSAGSLLWTETYDQAPADPCQEIQVTNGVFNTKLGSCNPLTGVDFTGAELYLSVNFDPGSGYDGEMSPRKQLVSSAYAFVANGVSGDGVVNNAIQSAIALSTGRTGANPALQVDTNTASSVTGLKVTSAAAAGGIALAAISSGANEGLTLDAKGSGTISLGATSTGDILLGGGSGSTGCTVTNASGNFTCTATITGATVNGTTALQVGGVDINTAGTLTNVAYENQANVFTLNQTLQKADPSIIFDVSTATDTDFWMGVQDDAGSDDDDTFQIGDGTSVGANPFLTINTSGNVGIGDTNPAALLTVGSGDLFQVNSSGAIAASVGITTVGGAVSLNNNSNFATSISTGTNNTLTTIGGGSGTFSLQTTNIDISSAGAISGATGISSSGTIAFSGLSTNGAVYTSGGTGTLNSEANLDVTRGGTGVGTFTTNGVLYGAGTSDLAVTAQGAANTVLVANAGAPSFSAAITVGTSVSSPTINATTALMVGVAGATTGTIAVSGGTSGTITIQPQAVAGTYNFNLPTTAGSSGYVLTSAGGGASPMTWTDPSGLGVRWNSIINPTGTQTLAFDDGELNAWTVSSNTETFHTITANSLTTGKVLSILSSSLTSGSLIDLVVTGTGGEDNQKGINVSLSGANAAPSQITYGGYFANTHTGGGTNVGLYSSANGGASNYGLRIADNPVSATLNVGVRVGDISDGSSVLGVWVGNLSGQAASGLVVGDLTGVVNNNGLIIGSINGGSSSNVGISVGSISGSGSSASYYGIKLDTLTGADDENTQISTGEVTAVAGAINSQLTLGAISGTAAGATNYGIRTGAMTSTGTVNYGINIGAVSGATNNYALITNGGNVGIGDTNPAALLTVGSGDLFQVNSSGAIAASVGITTVGGAVSLNNNSNFATSISTGTNNTLTTIGGGSGTFSLQTTNIDISSAGAISGATGISSSGTINFSGLSASSAVYTDGSSNLTSTAPTSGAIGYWTRASTTLSPTTANDIVSIANTTTTGADLALTNTGVYTGTGVFNLTANSATTGTLGLITGNGMTTGSLLSLSSSSAAATTGQKGLNVALTGALTGAQTTYGGYFSNTRTGATAVNVAAYFTASGATGANYAAIFDAGNVGIGTTAPAGKLHIAGNVSAAAWGVNGIQLQTAAATFTDTSSSGTVASNMVNTLGIPTLAASSSTTYTSAATLYIAGAPAAGSNVTLTNTAALIAMGNVGIGGAPGLSALTVSANSTAAGGTGHAIYTAGNVIAAGNSDILAGVRSSSNFRNLGGYTTISAYGFWAPNMINTGGGLVTAGGANFAIPTVGTSANYGLVINGAPTTATGVGIDVTNSGAVSGTGYGIRTTKSGAATTNVAFYATASGGTNNYAGIFDAGNVGIGDTTPAALLTVGSGDLFQVASNGNLTSSNAGTWTFSNDTNIALTGGVNGLSFNTDTLSIDATNGRVGIGTTSPGTNLTVEDDTNGSATVMQLRTSDGSLSAGQELRLDFQQATTTLSRIAQYYDGVATTAVGFKFYGYNSGLNSTPIMTMMGTGKVGIGDATPTSTLDILATGTYGAAGVSGIAMQAHTVTLSGADPTTYATFYANQIGAMTLVGTNANQTVTDAAGLVVAPAIKSTNVALTNTHGILIPTTAVSTATNAYGLTVNAPTGATNNYSAAFLGGNVGVGDSSPASLFTVGSGDLFQVNTFGDVFGAQTTLNGSSTASGPGTSSTTLVLAGGGGTNFDVGNYVKVDPTGANTCSGATTVCYAKITAKATDTLTISPALTWDTGASVVEVHVPEIGGIDLSEPLANRYGRGYFIDGIVTGNGSTYFTDNSIKQSIASSSFTFFDSNTTSISLGTSSATSIFLGQLNVNGSTGAILGGDGSAGTPTYAFGNAGDSGMYWDNSTEELSLSNDGIDMLKINGGAGGVYIPNGSFCVDSGSNLCPGVGGAPGSIYAADTRVNSIDLAENYPSKDSTLQPGETVMIDELFPEYVKRADSNAGAKAIGVVSTKPGLLLGDRRTEYGSDKLYPIALAGRVPVKVSNENGAILPGDFITSSTTIPGAAMKATTAGAILGQALEGYDQAAVGSISVFIKPTNYNGVAIEDQLAGLVFDYADAEQTAQTSEQILEYLLAQLPSLDYDNLSEVTTDIVIAGAEVVSPNVTTQNLRTDFLSSATSDGSLTVASASVFNGGLLVDSIGSVGGLLAISGDVEFFGTPYFTTDTAGFAVVKAGVQSVDVIFTREYLAQPIVNASVSFEQDVDQELLDEEAREVLKNDAIAAAQSFLAEGITYVVTNKSKFGFTIVLSKPAPSDVKMSWTALAVRNATTFMSLDTPEGFVAGAGSDDGAGAPGGNGGDSGSGDDGAGDGGTPPDDGGTPPPSDPPSGGDGTPPSDPPPGDGGIGG